MMFFGGDGCHNLPDSAGERENAAPKIPSHAPTDQSVMLTLHTERASVSLLAK